MDGQLSTQPNDSIMLLSVMWSEFSVAAVILTARILTRTLVISSWGWDDMSMCLSMVFLLYLAGERDKWTKASGTADINHFLGTGYYGYVSTNSQCSSWTGKACHEPHRS